MFKKENFQIKINGEFAEIPGLSFGRYKDDESGNAEIDGLFEDLHDYFGNVCEEYDHQSGCIVEWFDLFMDDPRFDDAIELANLIEADEDAKIEHGYFAVECTLDTLAEEVEGAKK